MDNTLFDEIEEKMQQLDRDDKLELVLDIISNLQGEEHTKALKAYEKTKNEYNEELHKAQENYWQYEEAYNIICENIY